VTLQGSGVTSLAGSDIDAQTGDILVVGNDGGDEGP